MAIEEATLLKTMGDKYRSFLYDEADDIEWRHGGPPTYDDINKLFEDGRTKEWPQGSLEEIVQNAVKSWEMELSHKTRLKDFKTINPEKFKLFVNGNKDKFQEEGLSGEETLRLGSYNALLKNSLPKEFQYYKAEEESFESSHDFRHWGFFEGPFKGHAPTGEVVQFYGLATLKYYDPAELFGGLLKGQPAATESSTATHKCPIFQIKLKLKLKLYLHFT
ncbi:hypothetical protein ACB098_05G214200 [Castanea mollissima]